MIQRKQTLFLLVVTIIGIVMFFVPFQKVTLENAAFSITLLTGFKTPSVDSNIYFPLVLNCITLILSIFTIFRYKNRVLQYKMANLLALINVFIIGLFFLLPYLNFAVNKSVAENGNLSYSFGAFLPIIAAISAFLAAHFIKKDEQLVRNADRIR